MLGLLAMAVVGCYRAPADRPAVMFFTCDTAGWIVPCGCSAGQSGGMPRRGGLIARAREASDVLVADVGGAPGGDSLYERMKFEAILRGESAMDCVAHNLGAAEAALGAEYLRGLAEAEGVPWVSCNVRDASGELIAPTLRLARVGGRRVVLIGLLSPGLAPPGVRVDAPKPALLEALQSVQEEYDFAVALAYLPEEELRELAESVPEIDLVIGGPTGQSISPERVGPTTLASVTNKGKFLAEVTVEQALNCRLVEVSSELDEDPAQVDNLNAFYERLRKADVTAEEAGFGARRALPWPADHAVAGSATCRECHSRDCDSWAESKHAHAWDTLVSKQSHVDPYCQQCHTTGYGAPGGFVSAKRSQQLTGVGCESCHGPSQRHAEDPRQRTMFVAKNQCLSCHDQENSPRFQYDAYWKRVTHGYPATSPSGEQPPERTSLAPTHEAPAR